MKVIICVTGSGTGGHTKSASATAKSLQENGVDILVLSTPNTILNDFQVNKIPTAKLKRWNPLSKDNLVDELKTLKYDTLHFFGTARLAINFALAANEVGMTFCLTIPGGTPHKTLCGFRYVAAFTDEISYEVKENEKIELKVMPARCLFHRNMRLQKKTLTRKATQKYLNNIYQIDYSKKIIGKIARCSSQYDKEIIQTAKDIFNLNKETSNDVYFIHAGSKFSLRSAIKINFYFYYLNFKGKQKRFISLQRDFKNIWRLSSVFDYQVAAGRSALEAIKYQNIVIQSDYKGKYCILDESTSEFFKQKNFSGRCASDLSKHFYPLKYLINTKPDIKQLYKSITDEYDYKKSGPFYLNYYSELSQRDDINFTEYVYSFKSSLKIFIKSFLV